MTREIASVEAIAEGLSGVLVDQFGVLHDGRTAFAGARLCLEGLRRRGIPAVALTNSGKRAGSNMRRLAQMGFGPDLIAGVVSSGELARTEIAGRLAAGRLALGAPVAVLSRGGDTGPLDGLGVTACPPGPEAALLFIAGIEPETTDRAAYRALLAPLAARGVPAICANPDHRMYVEGGTAFGPGIVAEDYAASGGEVLMLGKPGRAMFDAGLTALGCPEPSRVLMIGDSPAHDIAGAAEAGVQTLLIRGGAQAESGAGRVAPDFVMDRLAW